MAQYVPPPKRVQFVVKISKLCNLRCRYCYEYKELGDRRRISLENLEKMYRNIASWYDPLDPATRLEFVWHGGEPLLIEPDYYWQTLATQRGVFGKNRPIRNVVQTNLTKLDDERIRLLKDGFDGVGVSLDLFGGLRVDMGGQDSVRKVLANVDRLKAAKVPFGAITVVSRNNARDIKKIIRFFHELRVMSLRLLPLFDGAFEDQHRGYEITHEEMLETFKTAFDELLRLDSPLRVEPLRRFVNQVIHLYTEGAEPSYYDKRTWEPVLSVERDGGLYGFGDYFPEFCHGNLFETPRQDLFLTPGHLRACERAEARIEQTCKTCRFHGSCTGAAMADEAGRHRGTLGEAEELRCIVERGMLEHVEKRMLELGILDPIRRTVRFPAPGAAARSISRLPLQKGVHLYFAADADAATRIQLSEGTTNETTPPSDGLSYLEVAIVPREPWRDPADEEVRMLCPAGGAPKTWNIGSDLGVIRIPDAIMEPFEEIFEEYGTRQRLNSDARQHDHTAHPLWNDAYQALSEHLADRYGLRPERPTVVRLASANPGMRTVTKDTVKDRLGHYYVGLHLDTWERVPMQERNHARNRICVNMSREAREFLFINLTISQMHDMLQRGASAKIDDFYGTDLGHEFMRTFPGYPVVKVRVEPREAYIAPTDNLIHDATSASKQYPDIALHILGYFGLAPGETRVAGVLQRREYLELR